MPALPNVPKVLKFILKTEDFGGDLAMINRFFMQYSGSAPLVADLLALGTAVNAAWAAHLQTLYDANTQYNGVTIEDLTSSTSAAETVPAATIGTRAGGALGAGTAFVIKQLISRRYRGGHPRLYLSVGVTTDLLTKNDWQVAFANAVQAGWAAFITAVEAAVWAGGVSLSPVNVSYYQGFTNHTFPSGRVRPIPNLRPAPVIDVIAGYLANPKVGSQRRRNLQSA